MSVTCIKHHTTCIVVDTICECACLIKCYLDFTSLLSDLLDQLAEQTAMQNMLHGHDDDCVCTCLSRILPVCATKANVLSRVCVIHTWLLMMFQRLFPANVAGMPGMPSMTQEEMLAATLAGSGPKKVSKGKIRRKKGQTRGLAELAGLRR